MSESCTCHDTPTLAMASMPVQEWCEPYDFCTALKEGTIFPCLNLPFFKAKEGSCSIPSCCSTLNPEQKERETAMSKITQISFAINDLTLYLDTHPTCENGLALFHNLLKERLDLLADFARNYYPLTQTSIITGGCEEQKYNWDEGPMPWEGACI